MSVGLQQQGWQGTINDIDVANESNSLQPPGFDPCAVIVDNAALAPGVPPPSEFPGLTPTQYGSLTLFLDPAMAK